MAGSYGFIFLLPLYFLLRWAYKEMLGAEIMKNGGPGAAGRGSLHKFSRKGENAL
jgi:hypothetical protein